MTRIWCLSLAIGAALAAPVWAGDSETANDALRKKWKDYTKKIDFVLNYDEAVSEAKFSGRPMLLFFTATW